MFENKPNQCTILSQYIYICQSLHVSGCYVPIIRRYNCVYTTLFTCYSVWITVWYAVWKENHEVFVPHCIPDSYPHRITSTKCRMNTVVSPDDGPIAARNMQRLTNINILRKNCVPIWYIYKIMQRCTVKKKHIILQNAFCREGGGM